MSYTNDLKPNNSYSNDSKPSSSFSNDDKPSTSFNNDIKPKTNVSYIVCESLDFLTTQDGKLLVTQDSNLFSNDTKLTNNYINDSK